MDCKIILQKARRIFLDDYESEIAKNGVLPPSRNKSPLWPPWSVVEYAAMEKDTAKYFLYYSAVKMALRDFLGKQKLGAVTILILGPGRGRLIDYIIDCLIEDDMEGIVHVIEANKVCCEMLKAKYCDVNNVVIHESMAIRDYDETIELLKHEGEESKIGKLSKEKDVELIVSELFGSFGDNEFMPEILKAAMKIFGAKDCVSIPQSYTTILTPIYSPQLEKFFAQIAAKNQNVESIYILGLPHDTIYLSQTEKLYHRETCFNSLSELCGQIPFELGKSCMRNKEKFMANTDTAKDLSHILKVTTSQETNLTRSPCLITGFTGHFTSVLYKDIYIDTRPGSTRNTYFWETAFFPLNLNTRKKLGEIFNPACVRSGGELQKNRQELKVILRRVVKKLPTKKRASDGGVVKACCDPQVPLLQLHYEWSIVQGNDCLLGDVHNKDGRHHFLHL